MPRLPNYDPAEHTLRPEDMLRTRRDVLRKTGLGMGAIGLSMMLGDQLFSSSAQAAVLSPAAPVSPLSPKQPHFKAKAKHVIHIFAGGGPSHVDTWDPKPTLAKYEDQTLPGLNGLAYPSPFKFKKMGKSGVEVSELFPSSVRALTTCVSCDQCGRMCRRTSRLPNSCIRVRCKFRSHQWVLGWYTGWALKTRICRGSFRLAGRLNIARRRSCRASTRA